MNLAERIAELSAWLSGSTIDTLELTGPEGAIRLVRRAPGVAVEPLPGTTEPGVADAGVMALATVAGIFLDRHPLHSEPLVEPGARVAAGDHLGYLRVGLLLAPIVAPTAGQVANVLAVPGEVVGFGAPLLDIEPQDIPHP
ncbi:MAG: acetyl-CoA carboxylase biotin carboxyl carrier protein subunit [Burkholderiales bacterium]|nr:acetyl-CoA carboxylase biotin carboxyl carrier protein subunit [Burkholderiales bacterium]